MKIYELEDQWLPYLCALETGQALQPQTLLQLCCSEAPTTSIICDQQDLPSLQRLEHTLRCTAPGKATRPDPIPSAVFHDFAPILAEHYFGLMLKEYLWGEEPIQHKGGYMTMIYKKGAANVASNYRGIMLLSTVSKRLHALLRTDVEALLSRTRPQGQLGGFKGQQTAFAAQALRAFTNISKARGLNCAVLFIDLQNAFHRLPRELVLGVSDPQDWTAVLTALREAGNPMDAYAAGQGVIGVLERLQCAPLQLRILRNIHQNTWFSLTGSPLADVVFHAIMYDSMARIDHWIAQQPHYQSILKRLDLTFSCVIWADDVAIPWLTENVEDIVPAVSDLLKIVHQTFYDQGMPLNMDLGKTNAVITFRGAGAPAARERYQLQGRPGTTVELDNGQQVFLHFVPHYKHLGAQYAAAQSMDYEFRQRAGMAKAAFQQISKPVLCNRHIPETTRVQLFNSLIGTKLFYGLGSWNTPTPKQMKGLSKAYVGMVRRVLRLASPGQSEHFTNSQVLRRARLPDVRARMAGERLLYAQKLFQISPVFVQDTIQKEFQFCTDSWLAGLRADLQWLKEVTPIPILAEVPQDLTQLFEYWQSAAKSWKSQVRRAIRLHLQQEHMMQQVHEMHFSIFRVLQDAGYELMPDPCQRDVRLAEHRCHCGRFFTTPQGLATHQWKKHRQHAPEYRLITGSICQACMKYFWTSARLAQHLAYAPRSGAPNRCYAILNQLNIPLDRNLERMPQEVQGLNRREAQQTFGPFRAYETDIQRRHDEVSAKRDKAQRALRAHLDAPQGSPEQAVQLKADLDATTWEWFRSFKENDSDREIAGNPIDRWISCLAQLPEDSHPWAEEQFVQWGKYQLETIIENLIDGEAEFILEEVYGDILTDLPGQVLRAELREHQAHLRHLDQRLAEEAQPVPHRAVRIGTANESERTQTKETIQRRLGSQTLWSDGIRSTEWYTYPAEPTLPRGPTLDPWDTEGHFIIAHLFSGRRREGDVHSHLNAMAQQAGIKLTVLSLDTAVPGYYCNLEYRQVPWEHLMQLYQNKCISATIAGPPCETYSQARHTVLADGAPGPRPVRSAAALFGLENLTPKEYRQVAMGSFFFLQTMIAFAHQLVGGGQFIGEHPALPDDPARASIWRAAITEFFLRHPDVTLHTLPQWIWGATAVKPTGLLTLRLPKFKQVMFTHRTPDACKPETLAIGKNQDGTYKTSAHKEYPRDLCKAFAAVLIDAIMEERRVGNLSRAEPQLPPPTREWLTEVRQAGSEIRSNAGWLPDFQG